VQTAAHDIPELLKRALCEAFTVDKLGHGEWLISSPFLFRDGDGFSIYLRHSDDGWLLTDDGSAAAHLFFDDFDLNEVRSRHIETLADVNGLVASPEHALTRRLDNAPDAYDIADALLTMAQVMALPHIKAEASDRGFRRAAKAAVIGVLGQDQRRASDWHPPDRTNLWTADLYLPTADNAVVAFFVGNTPRADRAALTISQYAHWGRSERPVVGYKRRGLGSHAIYRLQEVAEDPEAVVVVDLDAEATGLLGFRRLLRERGVAVAV
jgi:hypothetical protein